MIRHPGQFQPGHDPRRRMNGRKPGAKNKSSIVKSVAAMAILNGEPLPPDAFKGTDLEFLEAIWRDKSGAFPVDLQMAAVKMWSDIKDRRAGGKSGEPAQFTVISGVPRSPDDPEPYPAELARAEAQCDAISAAPIAVNGHGVARLPAPEPPRANGHAVTEPRPRLSLEQSERAARLAEAEAARANEARILNAQLNQPGVDGELPDNMTIIPPRHPGQPESADAAAYRKMFGQPAYGPAPLSRQQLSGLMPGDSRVQRNYDPFDGPWSRR